MKFGIRKPSFAKRASARISPKRYVRHSLGLKVPRGLGSITNPKKAAYNRIYHRTSVSADGIFNTKKRSGKSNPLLGLIVIVVMVYILVAILF